MYDAKGLPGRTSSVPPVGELALVSTLMSYPAVMETWSRVCLRSASLGRQMRISRGEQENPPLFVSLIAVPSCTILVPVCEWHFWEAWPAVPPSSQALHPLRWASFPVVIGFRTTLPGSQKRQGQYLSHPQYIHNMFNFLTASKYFFGSY